MYSPYRRRTWFIFFLNNNDNYFEFKFKKVAFKCCVFFLLYDDDDGMHTVGFYWKKVTVFSQLKPTISRYTYTHTDIPFILENIHLFLSLLYAWSSKKFFFFWRFFMLLNSRELNIMCVCVCVIVIKNQKNLHCSLFWLALVHIFCLLLLIIEIGCGNGWMNDMNEWMLPAIIDN